MRILSEIKRTWLRLKCFRHGHDWFEHVDYMHKYRYLDTHVRHRTCSVCGITETAIPLLEPAAKMISDDTGWEQEANEINGIWVPREKAVEAMYDPRDNYDFYMV